MQARLVRYWDAILARAKNVDARHKAGHDEALEVLARRFCG
jgi:hypothetical protein